MKEIVIECGSQIGVLCYIMPMPGGRLHWMTIWILSLDYSIELRIVEWVIEWMNVWKSTKLEHYGRVRVKCEYYVYLLIYVQDKWQYRLSVTCYLYYEVHWFCFWVGDYPLRMWLLNPSISPFSSRCGYYSWPAECIVMCNSFGMCTCSSDWVM